MESSLFILIQKTKLELMYSFYLKECPIIIFSDRAYSAVVAAYAPTFLNCASYSSLEQG